MASFSLPLRHFRRGTIALAVLALLAPAYYRTKASLQIYEVLKAQGFALTPAYTASATRSRDVLGWFAGPRARRTLGEHWAALIWADALSGSRVSVASGTRYARLDTRNTALVGLALEYRGDNRRK
jgi:hypothetical protein